MAVQSTSRANCGAGERAERAFGRRGGDVTLLPDLFPAETADERDVHCQVKRGDDGDGEHRAGDRA